MAVRNKTDFIANEIYYITFTILDWQHVFTSDKYCQYSKKRQSPLRETLPQR